MSDYWSDNNIVKPPQRIVCAAIRNKRTGNVIIGIRHFDNFMREQIEMRDRQYNDKGDWRNAEQGFCDQFGQFLGRDDAYIIAKENGQIIREDGGNGDGTTLFSEMLY